MNKIFAACLMAVLCQSAFADDRWHYLDMAKNGSVKIYIDTNRSSPSNVWIKYVHQKKQPDNVAYHISQFLVNCQNKSMASRQTFSYNKSGGIIKSLQIKPYAPEYQYTEVTPTSLGETIVNYACTSSYSPPSLTPREQAAVALDAWGSAMQRLEPAEYTRLEPALLDYIRRTFSTLPHDQWLPAIQAEYYRLKRQQTISPQYETPLTPTSRY